MSKVYKIKGMDCVSCAMLIESDLEDEGIKCSCNFAKATLEVPDHNPQIEIKVQTVIKNLGYELE
jgi:copper chaperone CopZ